MNKSTFILVAFLLSYCCIESQDYLEMINSGQFTVQEIQTSAETYFENRDKGRGTGYKGYKRWEYDALRMQDDNGLLKSPSFYYNEQSNVFYHVCERTPHHRRVVSRERVLNFCCG